MNPEVGLADLVRAAHALRPRGRALDALAELCGYELRHRDLADSRREDGPTGVIEDDDVEEDLEDEGDDTATTVPSSVRHLEPVRSSVPSSPTDPLAEPATGSAAAVEHLGLFERRASGELLRAAARVMVSGDRLDIDAVVRALVLARPIDRIPTVDVPTLAHGVEVLIDVGSVMEPFLDDQRRLVDEVRGVVGGPVSARYFADDPRRGAGPERRRRSWTHFEPPAAGRAVLLLSDLGCGTPPRPDVVSAWHELGRQLRQRGNRVVALAPVRPARVPQSIRRSVEVVVWDRGTGRRRTAELLGSADA